MATDRTFFSLQTVSTTTETPSHPNMIPGQKATALLSAVIDLGDERTLGLKFTRENVTPAGWLAAPPVLEMVVEGADDAGAGTWTPLYELAHREWSALGPSAPLAVAVVSPHRYVRARGQLRPSQDRDPGSARFSLTARST